MSTENDTTPVDTDVDETNLEEFSEDFFNPKEKVEGGSTEDTDANPAEEDDLQTDDEDDDTLATEEDDDQEEEEKPAPKKNRAQERIEELNAKYREEERQRLADKQAYEAELADLRKRLEQGNKEPVPATKQEAENSGPSPTDLNEDGTDKYPLGEFDPKYLKDLVQFTLNEEREQARKAEEQTASERAYQEQVAELQANWNQKLDPARERYPDFQEKGEGLLAKFGDIEPSYGDYLTNTLMAMDHGPDVLYYLANNPDEAVEIVNSGAQKATIALGRIEAKFMAAAEEKSKARPKVSKASPPPPQNKGSSPAKSSFDPYSEDVDLDTLAKDLFKGGY